jgi:hypothetical protein
MSVNRVSTIFTLATGNIPWLFIEIITQWLYWLPLFCKLMQTMSLPPLTNGRQQSVNDFWFCILVYPRAVQRLYCITNMVATIMEKNGRAHNGITSYNWALWRDNPSLTSTTAQLERGLSDGGCTERQEWCRRTGRQRVYRDAGLPEMARATGNMYSKIPRADRQSSELGWHLIAACIASCIISYHCLS